MQLLKSSDDLWKSRSPTIQGNFSCAPFAVGNEVIFCEAGLKSLGSLLQKDNERLSYYRVGGFL